MLRTNHIQRIKSERLRTQNMAAGIQGETLAKHTLITVFKAFLLLGDFII